MHKVDRRCRGRQQLVTRALPVQACGVGGRASPDRDGPQGSFRAHAPVSPSPRAPAGEPREAGRKELGRTCVREKAAVNKHPPAAWRSCSASFCEFLSWQPFLHPVPPRLLLKPHSQLAHGAVRRHSPALSPQLTLGCRTFLYNAGVTARPLHDDVRLPTWRAHARTTGSTGQQIVRITRRPEPEPLRLSRMVTSSGTCACAPPLCWRMREAATPCTWGAMLLCFLSLAWHSSRGIPGLLCGLDPAGQVGGGGETLRRFARLQLQLLSGTKMHDVDIRPFRRHRCPSSWSQPTFYTSADA